DRKIHVVGLTRNKRPGAPYVEVGRDVDMRVANAAVEHSDAGTDAPCPCVPCRGGVDGVRRPLLGAKRLRGTECGGRSNDTTYESLARIRDPLRLYPLSHHVLVDRGYTLDLAGARGDRRISRRGYRHADLVDAGDHGSARRADLRRQISGERRP